MRYKIKNEERTYALISLFFTVLFSIKIFLALSLDPSGGMDFGFGISAILFFFVLLSLVSAYAFFIRSRLVDRFSRGDGVLLHISYSASEWRRYLELEHAFEDSEKKMMLIPLFGFSLLFSVIFLVMDPEAGLFVAGVLFVICLGISSLVFFILPAFRKKSISVMDPQAFLGKDGALIGNSVHNWNLPLSGFSKARLVEKKGEHMLQVDYFYLSPKAGYVPVRFHILVPKDKLSDAKKAILKMGE